MSDWHLEPCAEVDYCNVMHFVQKTCERLAAALIVLSGESNQTEAVEDNKSRRPWGFQNRPGAAATVSAIKGVVGCISGIVRATIEVCNVQKV